MMLRPHVPHPDPSPRKQVLWAVGPLVAALAAGLRRPRALGLALLPLLLALALPACQGTVYCNAAGALILGPALTVADGALYASAGGGLSVLRAGTGALIWHASANGVSPVSPFVADGTAIAAAGPGALVAFRVSDGSVAWHSQPVPRPQGGYITAQPSLALSGDVVYASASAGTIAAWRLADGSLLWQSPPIAVPNDPTYASGYAALPVPVPTSDAVYFSAGQSVHAVSAADGSLLWSSPALQDQNVYTPPVLDGGRLFVPMHDGSLYALDTDTGAILWHAPDPDAATAPFVSSGFILASPIVRDGIVYDAAPGGVRALDASSGAILWHLLTKNYSTNPSPSLQVAGGTAFVASAYTLSALDASTGAVRWNVTTQQATQLALLNGDTLYILSSSALTAWRASDGSSKWQRAVHSFGPTHLPQTAFDDGTLYVGTSGMHSCGGAIPPTVSAIRANDGVLLWQSSVPV